MLNINLRKMSMASGLLLTLAVAPFAVAQTGGFKVEEASIGDIQNASVPDARPASRWCSYISNG